MIPSFMDPFLAARPSSRAERGNRLCVTCTEYCRDAREHYKLIYMMAALPLTLDTLIKLRAVSKAYLKSANVVLSIWRALLYRLPMSKPMRLETLMIENHFGECAGHSAYMTACAAAARACPKVFADVVPKRSRSCRSLLCSRHCREDLMLHDIVLLHEIRPLREWMSRRWSGMELETKIILMPYYVFMNRYAPENVEPMIWQCKTNMALAYAFYFSCALYAFEYTAENNVLKMQDQLMKSVGRETAHEIQNTASFLNTLDTCADRAVEKGRLTLQRWFRSHPLGFLLPWDTHTRIINVDVDSVKVLGSSSRPMVIPLITERGDVYRVLYKQEDVRSDMVSMIVGRLVQDICYEHCEVFTYHVHPISPVSGVIEMVKGTTLYDIIHTRESNLINYLMETNPRLTVTDLRRRFMRSCVGACVLAWIMGVGDRHLENLMVTSEGAQLFHIDFSYILGDDPKHVYQPIRLTSDMVDALGGRSSQAFVEFQEQCVKVFTIVRALPRLWHVCLDLLTHIHANVSRQRIMEHVNQRFVPGEIDSEQASRVIKIVQTASGTSWLTMFADWTHSTRNVLHSFVKNPLIFSME